MTVIDTSITFHVESGLGVEEFLDVLKRSTLAERRPIDDLNRVRQMVVNANLTVCARDQGRLIGVARSVTDFAYCCYLSDLAVDQAYQRQGIGRELIRQTQKALHPEAQLILLAAPAAAGYYPYIGFKHLENAWIIPAKNNR